jgi:hypothetical protein
MQLHYPLLLLFLLNNNNIDRDYSFPCLLLTRLRVTIRTERYQNFQSGFCFYY